ESLNEEAPELFSFAVDYSKLDENSHQSREAGNGAIHMWLGQMRLSCSPQGIEHALIVFPGPIDRAHDRLIAANQERGIPPRLEVKSAHRVVPRRLTQQSPFAIQSLPKLCVWQCVKQPNHGHRNGAAANEIYLSFENVVGIIIKADDKPAHYFDSVPLN